jgi:mannose-6-phosphate isomerase
MSQLYPLKFKPILKEKMWGGNKLADMLDKVTDKQAKIGESWEISSVEGSVSVVSNGFLSGNNIQELLEIYMGDLIGDNLYEIYGNEFPLLIKIIDASELLSLQVHPDDQLAFLRHDTNGKTEMWHIIQADKGSKIVNGFREDIEKENFLELLANGELEKKLNYVGVEEEDSVYMPAGRVHCIYGGILLVEIQQTSDLTYRIYDWKRVDEKGLPRELHLEHAIDAIDYSKTTDQVIKSDSLKTVEELIACPFFTVNNINLKTSLERDYNLIDSFVIYVCTKGEFSISGYGDECLIKKGETVLIPAILKNVILTPLMSSKILEVFIEIKNF